MSDEPTNNRDAGPDEPTRRTRGGGRPTLEAASKLSSQILEAAFSLTCEAGFDALTMTAVSERAKVSKKTLYSRFVDKDDLVAAMLDHALQRHAWESGRRHGQGTVKERLFRSLQGILNSTMRPEMIAIERITQVRPDYEWHPTVKTTRLVPVQIVVELLREGKEEGVLQFDDPIVPAFMFLDVMILGPRTRYFKMSEQERRRASVTDHANLIFDTLWAGLAA